MEHQHVLDARGLLCPEPVMLLHAKIDDMAAEEVVLVLSTDPSTQRDIPKFCQFLGHALLAAQVQELEFHFYIRKT